MIRALEPTDLAAVRALAAATPDLDLSADAVDALVAPGRFAICSSTGAELAAVVAIAVNERPRVRHAAKLTVLARPDALAAAAKLIATARDSADRWWQLHRVELDLAIDSPLQPAGFLREVIRRDDLARGTTLATTALWAWTRSGLPIATAPPPPARPARAEPGTIAIRPATLDDAAGFARVMDDPGARWGTLQVPYTSQASWRARFEANDPARTRRFTADVAGEVIATAGLHGAMGAKRAHVWAIGMAVADRWQGRGVGQRLLEALLAAADEVGAVRVELDVYVDNVRAIGLYEKLGFDREGTKRVEAWRDRGYVDALAMARLTRRV